MKLKPVLSLIIIASLGLAACGKKQMDETKDNAGEIKKEVVKEKDDIEVKAKELEKSGEKKANEIKTEAGPKIQELQKEGAQKLDEAKAAIHEATAPTPTPPEVSPTPASMQ